MRRNVQHMWLISCSDWLDVVSLFLSISVLPLDLNDWQTGSRRDISFHSNGKTLNLTPPETIQVSKWWKPNRTEHWNQKQLRNHRQHLSECPSAPPFVCLSFFLSPPRKRRLTHCCFCGMDGDGSVEHYPLAVTTDQDNHEPTNCSTATYNKSLQHNNMFAVADYLQAIAEDWE